jgi:SAM-dependent methyltransferase
MKRIYYFAVAVFRRLPIPVGVKDKFKAILFAINPSLKSNLVVQAEEPVMHPRQVDRNSKLLSHISPLSQDGLEIGALCWPIVKKDESNGRIQYVDFSTAEKSREKYKDDPAVNIDDIVETDYLWGKQTLPELVDGRLFDYVIASHVIEHVPNMLGWMREIASVLKDGGILSLAIPDKRYTFDIKRDLTSLGTLVESYLLDKRRPGPRDIFDQVSLATKVDMTLAWSGKIEMDALEHHGTLQEALDEVKENLLTDEYDDVHVNILTPASYLDILENASSIGLFDFAVVDFYDTARNSHEFLVSLQRLSREKGRQENLALQLDSFAWARERLTSLVVDVSLTSERQPKN